TLPYSKEVTRSINEGLPVLASSPKSDIATRLVASIRAQLEAGQGAVPERARVAAPPSKGARSEKANRPARAPKAARPHKHAKEGRTGKEAQGFQPPQASAPQWPGRAPFPVPQAAAATAAPAHANGSAWKPRRRLFRWIGNSHVEAQA
ncbi:MAG: hypothetical protein ACRDYC_03835, partial [Acidimicrobiales bacterium]